MKEALKRIWTGNSIKKEYLVYFFSVFSIYIIGIVIAAAVYPGGFSFFNVYVSYLGGYPNNPDGYIIYNTSVFITGILLIPHFIFLYKRIAPTAKALTFLTCFFGILGTIGFAFVGVYYQGSNALGHQIATIIAFGGFGVSAFLMMFVLIRKIWLKENWPSIPSFLITYALIFLVLGFVLSFDNFPDFFASLGIDTELLGDRFLEWFYLLTVVVYLFGVVLITKDD